MAWFKTFDATVYSLFTDTKCEEETCNQTHTTIFRHDDSPVPVKCCSTICALRFFKVLDPPGKVDRALRNSKKVKINHSPLTWISLTPPSPVGVEITQDKLVGPTFKLLRAYGDPLLKEFFDARCSWGSKRWRAIMKSWRERPGAPLPPVEPEPEPEQAPPAPTPSPPPTNSQELKEKLFDHIKDRKLTLADVTDILPPLPMTRTQTTVIDLSDSDASTDDLADLTFEEEDAPSDTEYEVSKAAVYRPLKTAHEKAGELAEGQADLQAQVLELKQQLIEETTRRQRLEDQLELLISRVDAQQSFQDHLVSWRTPSSPRRPRNLHRRRARAAAEPIIHSDVEVSTDSEGDIAIEQTQ